MSRFRYLQSSVPPAITNFVYSLCAFASFILLSRNIEPEQFGMWALFLSLISVGEVLFVSLTKGLLSPVGTPDDFSSRVYGASAWGVLIFIWLFFSGCLCCISFLPVVSSYWSDILRVTPIVLFCSLGRINASLYLHVSGRGQLEKRMLFVHVLTFLFVAVILLSVHRATFFWLAAAYAFASLMASLFGGVRGWCNFRHIRVAFRKPAFGLSQGLKSTTESLSDNLLRSADILTIGFSPVLGALGVAVYAVPFRILEMVGMLLRPLSEKLADVIAESGKPVGCDALARLWLRFAIVILIVFIPFLGFFVLFPAFPVGFLGGGQYADYSPVMVTIVHIIVWFGFMMIPERLTDVVLNALGEVSFLRRKVMMLAGMNVIGNFIAVFYFQSLSGVALTTLLFTMAGVISGMVVMYRAGIRFSFLMLKEEWLALRIGLADLIAIKK